MATALGNGEPGISASLHKDDDDQDHYSLAMDSVTTVDDLMNESFPGGDYSPDTHYPMISSNNIPEQVFLNRYPLNHQGPYRIIIQPKDFNHEKSPRLDASIVGKRLVLIFKDNVLHLTSSGKYQATAWIKSPETANNLMDCQEIKDKGLFAFIDSNELFCESLIKGIPLDFDEEEIQADISPPPSSGGCG